MSFNRKGFADLLNRARGDRSINRFGSAAGVDPGYISRLSRGLVANAPSAAVINRLAEAAQNEVGAPDLMCAAGYLVSLPEQKYGSPPGEKDKLQGWEVVIEEAARYNITPDVAVDLIRTLGQSMEKIRK